MFKNALACTDLLCKYIGQSVNHSALAVCSVCMTLIEIQNLTAQKENTHIDAHALKRNDKYSILVHTCTAPRLQSHDRPHLTLCDAHVYSAIWGVICIVISRPLTQNEIGSYAAQPRELLNLAASEHPVSEREPMSTEEGHWHPCEWAARSARDEKLWHLMHQLAQNEARLIQEH